MNGPEITRQIRRYLEGYHNYYVFVANSNRPMPAGLRGLPDILAIGENNVLLIEVKGDGDRMREDQEKVKKAVQPMTGPNLRYIVARDLDDVIAELERIVT